MRARKIWLLASIFLVAAAGCVQAKVKNFNLAESGAVLSGYWPESTAAGRVYVGGSNGSQLDASVTGTVVVLTCFSEGSTNITVTVDGKTYTPNFFKLREWTTLTVSLGAAGTHSLTIKQPFLGTAFYLDTGTGTIHGPTFSVRGQAPSMQRPDGFGQQYQLSDAFNVTPFIQFEGGLAQADTAGYPSLYYFSAYPDEGLYFTASAAGFIKAWIYGGGSLLTLYQDGVNIGTVSEPSTKTFGSLTLFSGDGNSHRYGVVSSFTNDPGLFIWSLTIARGSLAEIPTIPRPRLLTYGDSIALGYLGTDFNSSEALSQRLGAEFGWDVYNRGITGSTVHEFPSGDVTTTMDAGEARTDAITSVSDGARGVLVLYGTNDMDQVGGPETIAQFQASYQSMLTSIDAGVPAGCPILCVGILPRVGFSPDTIALWNSGIQAAIAAVGAPNVQYADPSGWGLMEAHDAALPYADPAHNTADGIHPNLQGNNLILPFISAYFAPPGSPTVTSATSGTAQIGEPVAYQASASNAPTIFAASNLPAGLTLNATTGLISGTPTVNGTFALGLSATNDAGTGSEVFDLTVQKPVVRIFVTVPEVTVNGGESGVFALKLSSARSSDLRVNYVVGGDAVPGLDYAGLPGFVIIPAGATRTLLKIMPLGNLDGAASKNVQLRLGPGKDYSVGTEMPVKVKILAGQ